MPRGVSAVLPCDHVAVQRSNSRHGHVKLGTPGDVGYVYLFVVIRENNTEHWCAVLNGTWKVVRVVVLQRRVRPNGPDDNSDVVIESGESRDMILVAGSGVRGSYPSGLRVVGGDGHSRGKPRKYRCHCPQGVPSHRRDLAS